MQAQRKCKEGLRWKQRPGVYLLAPGKEIFLGSIFIRSGGGEFRAVVNVENAADSGLQHGPVLWPDDS